VIPEGKFCRFTATLNGDSAIHISILGGAVMARNRVGSVASLNAGLVYDGTASPAIKLRSSSGITVTTPIYPVHAGFSGTVIDLSHVTASDTQYFNLKDSVIVATATSCAVGIDMDKTINSSIIGSTIFGCVKQIRGATTAGSYSGRNTVRQTSFQP